VAQGDYGQALEQLLAVEAAAPQEAARPSLRALTGELLTQRPHLAGLRDFAARTGAAPTVH
jgi:hypothetical protein